MRLSIAPVDWDEGGASMDHLADTVVQAALEFGKGGLETSLDCERDGRRRA